MDAVQCPCQIVWHCRTMQNVEEQVNISWQLRVAAATALGLIRPLKTLEAKLKLS